MPAQAAGLAERDPERSRLTDPALYPRRGENAAAYPRRGEIAAAAATAAVAGQLAVAPMTLALTGALVLIGRVARWRPHWLAIPALTGLALVAESPQTALGGFLVLPRTEVAGLRAGMGLSPIVHRALVAGSTPGQLPLALLVSTAEAGILLWAGLYRRSSGCRSGVIALVRRRVGRAALAAGRTVTLSGCAVGVEPATGRLATVSWAELELGVLASAPDQASLIGLSAPVVAAALRRRMAVVILDLTPGRELTPVVTRLGHSLGLGVSTSTEIRPATLGHQILRRRFLLVPARGADLAALAACLRGLADLGIRGDALVWVHGCEEADAEAAARLMPLGPPAGTGILVSTGHVPAPVSLASAVAVSLVAQPEARRALIVRRPGPGRRRVRYAPVPLRAV